MLFIGLHQKNYPERLISGIDILFGLFEALSIEQEFSKTNNIFCQQNEKLGILIASTKQHYIYREMIKWK